MPLDIERKRRAAAERAGQVSAILLQNKRGLLLRVRISRIPEAVAEIVESGTVKLVGPRLGEYFDAAVAELVVLRRERILIDADFADGLLRRQLAAAETIDEDLASGRSSRWPGK